VTTVGTDGATNSKGNELGAGNFAANRCRCRPAAAPVGITCTNVRLDHACWSGLKAKQQQRSQQDNNHNIPWGTLGKKSEQGAEALFLGLEVAPHLTLFLSHSSSFQYLVY
jgi:hypothetical protein